MPPFVPRKRKYSPHRTPSPVRPKRRDAPKSTKKPDKSGLFAAVDAPTTANASAAETKKFIDSLDDADDASSPSQVDSDEFEDVPASKRRRIANDTSTVTLARNGQDDDENDNDDDDDDMVWEDALQLDDSKPPSRLQPDIADISISLDEEGQYVEPLISLATGKKGPSKRERQTRVLTHSLHVLTLMWHNTVRNSWLNDKEVQKILVDSLPEGVKREVTRWKEAMGMLSKEELESKKKRAAAKNNSKRGQRTAKKSAGRDWSYDAAHLEQGVPNLSSGDPLLRLLKVLTAYWRKRFVIGAPGLRKRGYMPLKRLRDQIRDWDKNRADFGEHGERIEDRSAFRELARRTSGSRDVGAQLFVALLRGLGLETRMVVNLQPAGLSFTTREEADPKPDRKEFSPQETESTPSGSKSTEKPRQSPSKREKPSRQKITEEKPTRKSERGNKAEPINLDDSDSELSDPPSDIDGDLDISKMDSDDSLSVIDITPNMPQKKPSKKFDRDLAFPNYWAEVCSPVSHKFIPVDPIVLSTIASTDDLLQTFEPRGKRAEKAKQVICYTIAFHADGSAKDVTIRYLKKHQLPGKTKGMRVPVERVPIYTARGKVKKYEEYDWFRTVMNMYDRPPVRRTTADDLEEQTDLKPFKPSKEGKEVEKESLQWYKQSAEFVLEQHLRREEAIIPGAKPVRTFTAGKGDKAKEHPVYRRKDVVPCKTVESWHKEGRTVQVGEQPMKYVPVRAVTLLRKREMEETFRETGEKMRQGLYSRAQTDWIIPPPIENGVIPKNAFGNMDVYVPTMVPKGAVHLPLKGTAKLCRRLEIDYAEACTGFEFGAQRAVPVLTGVVVAKENEKILRDAWHVEQAELKRKEDTKRTAAALQWWRKMVMGLRILERMKAEYDHAAGTEDEVNPFINKAMREGRAIDLTANEVDTQQNQDAGGFLPPDPILYGDEDTTGGGFLVEDDAGQTQTQDLLVEPRQDMVKASGNHTVTPVSLQFMHQTSKPGSDRNDDESSTARVVAPSTRQRKATIQGNNQGFKARVNRSRREEIDTSDLSSLTDLEDRSSEGITPAQTEDSTRSKRAKSERRATALRSKYFEHNESEGDDEEESESDEVEIIRPQRTTPRTRARS